MATAKKATKKAAAPKKAAKVAKAEPKQPEFRTQKDKEGNKSQVDISVYSHKVECTYVEADGNVCGDVRYCKPQDAFQVKKCWPHSTKKGFKAKAPKAPKAAKTAKAKKAPKAAKNGTAQEQQVNPPAPAAPSTEATQSTATA